jgi:hypothetical protein
MYLGGGRLMTRLEQRHARIPGRSRLTRRIPVPFNLEFQAQSLPLTGQPGLMGSMAKPMCLSLLH